MEYLGFPSPAPWPWSSICIYWQCPSVCFYQPCLFFVLELKFVIVTVSTYLLICTYFLSIMWEISKLFEIFSQGILSIFLIDYNWSHSVHFHFVIQLLQLFYIDMMLICKKKFIKKKILHASWKFLVFISCYIVLKHVLNELLFYLIWLSWFHFVFSLFDLTYSSQLYFLICFLLKLSFVSFLSAITVAKRLDSKNVNSKIISKHWLLLFPTIIDKGW